MSTILISTDKKHYVLSLSLEEAQLLGTFHHKHVSGLCPLNKVLQGLPFLTHAEFNTWTAFGWKPVFHEIVLQADATSTHKVIDRSRGVERHLDYVIGQNIEALEARVLSLIEQGRFSSPLLSPNRTVTGRNVLPYEQQAQSIPSNVQWRVECNFGLAGYDPSANPGVCRATFPTRQAAEAAYLTAIAALAGAVPKPSVKPVPSWIVQYKMSGGDWVLALTRGLSEACHEYPAGGTYSSRNEAYRQLRTRAARFGKSEACYRVVPATTKDGPENDRGYYVVEFWSKHYREWRVTLNGPGIENNSDGGRYKTAAAAAEDIKRFGYGGRTYRVKWWSSKA